MTKYDRYRLKDVEGYRKKKREWARSPEQRRLRREYMRLWRDKNRARHNELCKQSHQRNKHKHVAYRRNYHLVTKYGITSAQYDQMLAAQNGVCYLCEKSNGSRKLHVDHNHKTNAVRKLLCTKCNGMIGVVEACGLVKLAEYLK